MVSVGFVALDLLCGLSHKLPGVQHWFDCQPLQRTHLCSFQQVAATAICQLPALLAMCNSLNIIHHCVIRVPLDAGRGSAATCWWARREISHLLRFRAWQMPGFCLWAWGATGCGRRRQQWHCCLQQCCSRTPFKVSSSRSECCCPWPL